MTEKQFEEKLKDWLESEGIYPLGTPENEMTVPPCGYWEKRWGGGKYVKAGLPDMHIVVNGVSIEAELKVPPNKPSALQIQKINQVDKSNCIGVVLYPKDFENFKSMVLIIKGLVPSLKAVIEVCGLERGWKNA